MAFHGPNVTAIDMNANRGLIVKGILHNMNIPDGWANLIHVTSAIELNLEIKQNPA